MQVSFVDKPNGPSRLVCEAEVTFEAEGGPLVGMKLVGFSVWRSVEGELYVTEVAGDKVRAAARGRHADTSCRAA